MKRKLTFGIGIFICLSATLFAQSAGELYQRALVQENGAGDLQTAIQLYQRAAKEAAGDRRLAALALMGAARCYERLGQSESMKLYEEVTRLYPDQQEQAALANQRLSAVKPANDEKARLLGMVRQLEELRQQGGELAAKYTPQHPQLRRVRDQFEKLDKAVHVESQKQKLTYIAGGIFAALDSEPDKPIIVSGIVKEVDWTNPNVWITVETKTRSYRIKGKSPKSLVDLMGWTQDAVRVGNRVNVEGLLISTDDPSIIGFATLTVLDTGRRLYAGNSVFP